MSGDAVTEKTSDILARIDLSLTHGDLKAGILNLLSDSKKQFYFLESEIAQLKKACAEWSEVSQHNYQKAKSMALALDAIKAVVKAMPSTYTGDDE